LGAGRGLRDADLPVVVRPPRAGLAVRGADAAAVLHAPREHQAAAIGHREPDRPEVVSPKKSTDSDAGCPPYIPNPVRNFCLEWQRSSRPVILTDDKGVIRFASDEREDRRDA